MSLRPAKPKQEWQDLFTLHDLTPAQKAFLDSSVVSVDVKEWSREVRLNFKGDYSGPYFKMDDPNLNFRKITKGAFKEP